MKPRLVLKGLAGTVALAGIPLSIATLFAPPGRVGHPLGRPTPTTVSVTREASGELLVFRDGAEVRDPAEKARILAEAGEEIWKAMGICLPVERDVLHPSSRTCPARGRSAIRPQRQKA